MSELFSLCEAWDLLDFWHIHVNINGRILEYDGGASAINKVAEHTKRPIRVTTASGDVTWFYNGKYQSPFEPASYETNNGEFAVEFSGFEPETGLIRNAVNVRLGHYNVQWHPHRLTKDLHTELSTSMTSSRRVWGDDAYSVMREGAAKYADWDKLKSTFGDDTMVRYMPRREVLWVERDIGATILGSMSKEDVFNRADETKPTAIVDRMVCEQGTILPSGMPQVVRLIAERSIKWATVSEMDPIPMRDERIPGGLHRADGPAHVVLKGVKEIVMGDVVRTQYQRHGNRWYKAGKAVSQTAVQNWAKRHGITIRDGALHDQPGIFGSVDITAWLMS